MRARLIAVGVALATIVIALGIFFTGYFVRGWVDQRSHPTPAAVVVGQAVVEGVSADDDPAWGVEDSPVTIVEFSDFGCPFSRRHFEEVMVALREAFSGQVRYIFRDFPIGKLHPNAPKAAEAAQCAAEQDRFWEYHDRLFADQEAQDVASLKRLAANLGLETGPFDECLDSGKYAQEVQADIDAARSYGVQGTPTLFVNGRKIVGAQPYSVVRQIIDEELAKAAGSQGRR